MGLSLRYLDSSVVLDVIDPAATRHSQIDAALRSFPPSEFRVSDLVRLECLVHALRTNDPVRLADLRAFFASVIALALDSPIFDKAAGLRAAYPPLKTPDALHLSTALHHGCTEFWTNDLDLVKRPVALAFRPF